MRMQYLLLTGLMILNLTACSSSQDTASNPTKTAETELDANTKQIMQTDLSESSAPTPNDEIPLASEVNMDEPVEMDTSGHDSSGMQANEQFEIKVYRAESQGSMTGYIDKIDIVSLNDQPTNITGIQINRGSCAVTSMYDYSNMRYGSVALAYPRCKVEYIREVSISTAKGTYAYQFH